MEWWPARAGTEAAAADQGWPAAAAMGWPEILAVPATTAAAAVAAAVAAATATAAAAVLPAAPTTISFLTGVCPPAAEAPELPADCP